MTDQDYGMPVQVYTIKEDADMVRQMAVMLNAGDAILYARQCRTFGADAKIPPFDPTVVVVEYKKDSEGKIGIAS